MNALHFKQRINTQRAVVIRNRFAVLLLSLPNLRHWVSGGTSAQGYEATVSLAQALLDVAEHRSISAFRSLESFLSGYSALQLVVGMTSSVSAAERCTALVARVRDERRNRPADRDGGSNDPAPAAHGGGSTERVGAIFNNMASYGDVIEEFLRAPDVTGKLLMMALVDDEGEEHEEIDTAKSGLLALVSHRDIRNNNKEMLQVAYQRYSQVINQAWCTGISQVDPDFAGCRKCHSHARLMGGRSCAGPTVGPLRAKHMQSTLKPLRANTQKSWRDMTSAWYHVSLLCAVRSRTWHHASCFVFFFVRCENMRSCFVFFFVRCENIAHHAFRPL